MSGFVFQYDVRSAFLPSHPQSAAKDKVAPFFACRKVPSEKVFFIVIRDRFADIDEGSIAGAFPRFPIEELHEHERMLFYIIVSPSVAVDDQVSVRDVEGVLFVHANAVLTGPPRNDGAFGIVRTLVFHNDVLDRNVFAVDQSKRLDVAAHTECGAAKVQRNVA